MAFGTYTARAYFQHKQSLTVTIAVIALALAVAYALFIFCYRTDPAKDRKKIRRRRLRLAGRGAALILCIGLTVNMTVIGAHTVFGIALVEPTTAATNAAQEDGETIAKNIETLTLLDDKSWDPCPAEKRVDVLQVVANIEQTFLGLPHPLHVGASYLREGLYGYYGDMTHSIIVNLEYLMERPSYEMVDTIAHEAFHALQHREVDAYDEARDGLKELLLYFDASIYKEEFANYPDCFDDFENYYALEVERSARVYVKQSTIEYFERINQYLTSFGD